MRKGSGFSKIRVRELASAPLFAQETGERAAARAADMDRSEQVLGAVTTAIKMLPSLVHGQQQPGLAAATPAAPAPPAPAVSRFSSMAELLDSITKFTAPLRSELLEKFEQEMLHLSDILDTYKLGGSMRRTRRSRRSRTSLECASRSSLRSWHLPRPR